MRLAQSPGRLAAARHLLALAGLAVLAACTAGPASNTAQSGPDSPAIAIDVLLEPDNAMVETARKVNAKLKAAYPAGYSLDASHAPHITLLQRYVREADLKVISATLGKLLTTERVRGMRLRSQGYYAAPWGKEQVLVILVERTPELVELQAEVAEAVRPYTVSGGSASAFALDSSGEMDTPTIGYVETFVPKSSGANYQPHITVGVAPEAVMNAIKSEALPPQPFNPAAGAIFQLGRFGTAQKRLWATEGP